MKTVIVLKPDFFEEQNLNYLGEILEQNNLTKFDTYKISDYFDFCTKYRDYDINHSDLSNEERVNEAKKTQYATYAYSQEYKDTNNFGAVLIFDTEKYDFDIFNCLLNIKSNVRKFIKTHRNYEFYVDISQNPWKTYKHIKADTNDQEYISSDAVKLAYLNGIHMEDENMFERQICFSFLIENDTLSPNNKIQLSSLYEHCNISNEDSLEKA